MRYGLGLDVGANSLGWSVFALDDGGEPAKLQKAGVRIFTDGRDEKSMATLAAERREARTTRRRRDRYLQRRMKLLNALTVAGLLPTDAAARRRLQNKDPLRLRAEGAVQKLGDPYHIGRALFHLNQRRGFKSNRKDAEKDEKESGKITASVAKLREEMARAGSATFGAHLYAYHQQGAPVRARQTADGKQYDNYPNREMLLDEFNIICEVQQKHYPHLLGADVVGKLRDIIFYQRELKEPQLGLCAYIANEERAYRALPSMQTYRIYQEVNNLEWVSAEGEVCKLRDLPKARDAVVALLQNDGMNDKGKVSFHKIKKAIHKCIPEEQIKTMRFNLESDKRKELDGNGTAKQMRDKTRLGAKWDLWDSQQQDDFVGIICGGGGDDTICARLVQEFGISESAAKECIKARLQSGAANISKKAAELLTEKMRDDYCLQPEAVRMLDEDESHPHFRAAGINREALLTTLPYYGEAFGASGRHIIPGSKEAKDKKDERKYWGGVSNPSVHIALNQIRRVINELVQIYDAAPETIAIELGRELPMGAERRNKTNQAQAKNQNINEELNAKLRKMQKRETHNNRRRLRLWEELGDNAAARFCPYSGELITEAMAFGDGAEVDHILPFQDSLDDTNANVILCTKSANRAKGKQTPFEAFGASPQGYAWDDILARAAHLPRAKAWRFMPDARQVLEGLDGKDFLARHLNDTRYIGVLAKDYLAHICKASKIRVLTGRLTSLLRAGWKLGGILQDNNEGGENNDNNKPKKKNRDDHRHHAVDAIVAGATTRAIIQQVSRAAERCDSGALDIRHLFDYDKNGEPITPWQNFRQQARDAVGNIIVSHKPRRKKQGKLHNETAYGIIRKKGAADKYYYRKQVAAFANMQTLAAALGKQHPHLREGFALALGRQGKVGAVEWLRQKGVRRLRVEEKKAIPIKDKTGKAYKALKPDGNWCAELYAYPDRNCDKAGEWHAEVITRFDANQKGFVAGITRRPHPAAKLIMRLHKNDYILATIDGEEKLMRLQKMSSSADGGEVRLEFAEPHEANVARRNADKHNPFKFWTASPRKLKQCNARKVHVSPAGRLQR